MSNLIFEHLNPITAAGLRPIVALLIFISFMGYGSIFPIQQKGLERTFIVIARGIAVSLFFLGILGILNLFEYKIIFIFLTLGWYLIFIELKNNPCGIHIKMFLKWYALPIYVIILTLMVRASAPPYFVDTCMIHYPLAENMALKSGIAYFKHASFVNASSSLFPQLLFVPAFIFGDGIVANWLTLFFALVSLFQIKIILTKMGSEISIPFTLLAWVGCGAWFHNVAYAKIECVYILLIFEIVRIILDKIPNPKWIGFLASMLFFYKFTFIVIIPSMLLLFIYIHSSQTLFKLEFWKKAILSAIPPIILWLLMNGITQGMWLYPFIADPNKIPLGMAKGAASIIFAQVMPWPEKLQYCLSVMFLGRYSGAFQAYLFSWIILCGIFFLPKNKRLVYLSIWGAAIMNWLFWALIYKHYQSSFRQSFSGWIIPFLLFSSVLAHYNWARILMMLLAVGSCLLVIKNNSLYLPGIRYNLGQQKLTEYYLANQYYVVADMQDDRIKNLTPKGNIAVISEYTYLFPNNKKSPFMASAWLDSERVHSEKDFREMLSKTDLEYFFVDLAQEQVHQNTQKSIGKWIVKAESNGDLELLFKMPSAYFYKNNRFKNTFAP